MKNAAKTTAHLWIILVAIAAIFFGYRAYRTSKIFRPISKQHFTVNVDKATTRDVQTVLEFVGTAISNESVDITSTVTQKVAEVNFSDCDFVKAGDVLVQLNVEKQKAILKQAEINYMEQAREMERIDALQDSNAISGKEYDEQETRLHDALAKFQEAEAEVNEGTIVAPFDGILGIRKVSVGTLLTPNTVITTIDDIKKIKVDFSVPERYLSLINDQCKITATSIALPGRKFYGVVQAVSPRISTTSRSIYVRGIIDNDNFLIKPGMTLDVKIKMQDRKMIMVPEAAVFSVGEKHFVFLLDDKNIVRQKEIEIGQRQGNLVEICKGLKQEDTIVVEGAGKISDGDQVNVGNAGGSESGGGKSENSDRSATAENENKSKKLAAKVAGAEG